MRTSRKITALKSAIAVVVVVAAFLAFRYRSPPTDDFGYARDSFLRDTIMFGSCGFAALVCVALAVLLFRAARASRIHRVLAVVLFIPLSLATALIPVPLIPFAASFWSERTLFSGDSGFAILLAPWLMVWFSGAAILFFLVAILCSRPLSCAKPDENRA
jgi:hypothetical protein